MKISDIFLTANGNLFKSKLRSALTVIAIFIGALTLTLTNGIGAGVSSYIDEQLGNIGADDMFVIQAKDSDVFGESNKGPQKFQADKTAGNIAGLPITLLNQKDLDSIRSVPGIKSAEFETSVSPSYITGPNEEKYKLTVSSYHDGVNISIRSGNTPDNHTNKNQILLTPDFPSALGFDSDQEALNQEVAIGVMTPSGEIQRITAVVVGVQEQTIMNMGGLIINNALNKDLFEIQMTGLPASAKTSQPMIVARFDASKSKDEIKQLKDQLSQMGYRASTIRDRIGIIKQVIDAIIMVLNFFAGIALLAASFGIVNTLLMAIQERTKEIGLMKAVGMSNKKIFMLFSTEAILLGFWGSLLGSIAGIGIGRIANSIASKTFLRDLVGFELTSFPITSIMTIMLIVMLIAFIAGTMPARKASKKDPIEALRYE